MEINKDDLTSLIEGLSLSAHTKTECPMQERCTELDPDHFEEFKHEHLDTILKHYEETNELRVPCFLRAQYDTIIKQIKVLVESSQNENACGTSTKSVAEKLEAAWPYNFFLSSTISNKLAKNEILSISLVEILDKSLGEIETSAQINFCIDEVWLMDHYRTAGVSDSPILLIHGDPEYESTTFPNITAVYVKPEGIGLNHSKIMLLGYKDGSMRVIISTANLIQIDWGNNTQGIWISPKLHKIRDDKVLGTDSPTNFQTDFIHYLSHYQIKELDYWIKRLKHSDCSAINVCLVYSVPGPRNVDDMSFGHLRLADLLSQHVKNVNEADTVIAQSPSVGMFGPTKNDWAGKEFLTSASASIEQLINDPSQMHTPLPKFNFVYPTCKNVKESYDGFEDVRMYTMCKYSMYRKQKWIQDILCQWKAEKRHRSRCMPHIKTYCRVAGSAFAKEPEGLRWFLLTSANMSKNAWGSLPLNPRRTHFQIGSYELGVLFLPKFIFGTDLIPLSDSKEGPAFPMPYDLPLVRYGRSDKMFFTDLPTNQLENGF
uniref:Putative tyrosyl-dna phosphodiesterase n=1 Tax=Xenopsylla cheopis TaxID=163159 RepID=A0A6M2DCF0_XENCH